MKRQTFWQKVFIARMGAGEDRNSSALHADLALTAFDNRKRQGDFRKQNKAL